MEPKKRRGRPKGATKKGDEKLLQAMADLMLKNPALNPTAAIKKIVHEWTDTIIHRLRSKWKAEREILLEEARQRHNAAVPCQAVGDIPVRAGMLSDFAAIVEAQKLIDSPALRIMREIENNPILRLQREIDNNPALRMMREMQNNSTLKLIREQERLRRSLGL